jgi:hypothetical protein
VVVALSRRTTGTPTKTESHPGVGARHRSIVLGFYEELIVVDVVAPARPPRFQHQEPAPLRDGERRLLPVNFSPESSGTSR